MRWRVVSWIAAASFVSTLPAWAGVESYRQALQDMDGLVDYFPLDRNANDIVDGGNGFNDGQIPGPPPFGPGLDDQGQGLVFDGTDHVLTVARSIQDEFTIIAWIRTDAMGQGNDFSQFYEGSGLIYADVPNEANDFGTAITGSTFGFGIGNPASTIHSTSQVTTGEWIQVAAVRRVDPDASVSYLRVYVNGVLETEEIHSNILPVDAPPAISIGGNSIDRRYYSGDLDEVALFGLALETDEIEELYDAIGDGVAKYRDAVKAVPGLLDYYDYEGTYDDVFDGGNGFNNPDPVGGPTLPTWEPGVGGEFEGARFDGVDDVFPIERSIQDSFSILAWILVEDFQIGGDTSQFYEGSGLVYADVAGETNDFGTAVTGSKFAFGVGNPAQTIRSTTDVVTGEWIHVAAVREVRPEDGAAEIRVYVNGVREAAQAHTNLLPVDANPLITIGGNTIDRRFFRGMLDEVALFGAALQDEDVASAYNAYLGLTPCFAANPLEGFSPLLVDFDASCSKATAGTITSYYWEFGDGGTATGAKVSHTFSGVGAFTVKLTITSSEGISASTTRVVTTRFQAGDVSPWVSEDVGGPASPGGARRDGDCLVVYAHGRDIASRSDQFHFLHRELEGDGSLTAQFTGFEPEAIAAKAGLMMRATTAPDSAFVAVALQNTAGTQVAFIRRTETGGLSRSNLIGVVTLPVWLKLERTGGEIIAFRSEDGSVWSELGRETIQAEGAIRAGIAATGRDSGTGAAVLSTACGVQLAGGTAGGELFHRGDANGDGGLNITDGIFVLNYLFLGGPTPGCLEAANANDDESINITDGIFILNFLFLGGSAPPAPGPADSPCGPDPPESPSNLGCETYEPC